tara:strand:- start:2683 stop:3351 length:669 start_codon:yes stop_codon:yes gene_type:complete
MNLEPEIFEFLKKLKNNNNRPWFKDNKTTFDLHNSNVKQYFSAFFDINKDYFNWESFKVFRIYKDVRFSKDKTPYKTHFAISFHRSKPKYRGGFYIHIQPGNTFIASGFWNPNKDDLFRIRKEIESDGDYFKGVIENKNIVKKWDSINGNSLKVCPKGFDKNHPFIDLLRYKQFIFVKNFQDNIVLKDSFSEIVRDHFKLLLPFHDYFSDVLTTDLNGQSIL